MRNVSMVLAVVCVLTGADAFAAMCRFCSNHYAVQERNQVGFFKQELYIPVTNTPAIEVRNQVAPNAPASNVQAPAINLNEK